MYWLSRIIEHMFFLYCHQTFNLQSLQITDISIRSVIDRCLFALRISIYCNFIAHGMLFTNYINTIHRSFKRRLLPTSWSVQYTSPLPDLWLIDICVNITVSVCFQRLNLHRCTFSISSQCVTEIKSSITRDNFHSYRWNGKERKKAWDKASNLSISSLHHVFPSFL